MIMSYSAEVEMSYSKLQYPDVNGGGTVTDKDMITLSRRETK